MMQKIILTGFVCISLSCNAQFFYSPFPPTKNDYSRFEKERVKIGYEYELNAGNKILISEMEFGNMGLPAASYEKGINTEGDSATLSETIYKYNHWLKLSSYSIADFEENQKSVVGYTYDTKGRLIKKISASFDPVTTEYKYDAAGRIISEIAKVKLPELNKDGDPTGKSFEKLSSKTLYKYDVKNRLTEEWFYFADMGNIDEKKPFSKQKREYNNNNEVSKISNFNQDGNLNWMQEFIYNAKGLLVKKTETSYPGKEIKEFIYEYCMDCKQSWMQ